MLIVQETHSSSEFEQVWKNEWGGEAIFSHGTNQARGIAVFMTKKMYSSVRKVFIGSDGRTILFDLEECDQIVTIVAIYAPNNDCPNYFTDIGKLLKERSEHKIIIGDFNLTLDVELDRKNTYCNNNKALNELESIMEQYYLKDIWRVHNPELRQYSWYKRGDLYKASRIDLALVSAGLDQKVEDIQYISSIKTDHRAIYMVVTITPYERGTGYWKFNNSFLQKKEFVQRMNNEIDQFIEDSSHHNPLTLWERLKIKIRNVSKDFARNQTSEENLIISQLSEKVNEYEASLPLNKDQDALLEETKTELEEKLFSKVKGMMFRSKAKWYEQGEKSSKYFFSLEKARYNAKTCYKILDELQQEVEDPHKILELQKNFYMKLYQKDEDVNFTLRNNYGITVPEELKLAQEQQLILKDFEEAIKTMNNNKTPGQDGIPVDFYKVFWPKIKDIFYEMVLAVYEQKLLHATARRGILNLIPKAGKDTRIIKNLRPITLLNTDYKIIEKAIANRMIPALGYIINKDQRGFMKERRISVNIRKMLDIIHQAEKDDLEAIVLSLDFVKCFDKCSYSILHGSLEFFDFGSKVKEWTKILYDDFTVKIQNNGHFSEEIKIEKGVHQGGCCSSVYFLVIAEILALALRSNQDIDGITIADLKNLLNQFADDMDIFSLCNQKSLENIYSELQGFYSQSGFTVSYEKTTLYRIGSLRHSNAQLFSMDQFKWSNEDINVLGITISHNDLVSKNYDGMEQKVKGIFANWQNRGLSLIGKIQVVNTLVASLFVYKMMVLPSIPRQFVTNFDNIVREYLWSGRKAKIAYRILQNPKGEGGLGLVNLAMRDKALKATWPKILNHEQEYATLVYKQMKCSALKEDVWRFNLELRDINSLKIRNDFWVDVLKSWNEYRINSYSRWDNQLIWYNSKIRIKDKPFMWNDVYQRGLKFVYQLFESGDFKSDQQVQTEFGLSTLRFNSLKSVIPSNWKEHFRVITKYTFLPIPPSVYDTALLDKNLASHIYKTLLEDRIMLHPKFLKWKDELGGQYDEAFSDFIEHFRSIYRISNVAKYRSFQYRVLQRALVTNVQLHKWGLTTDEYCHFCKLHKETVPHMLFYCENVQEVWEKVIEFVHTRYNINIFHNPQAVIMNTWVKGIGHVANLLCLLTKQYVYSQRCLNKPLSWAGLKERFKQVERIEKYIAAKNDRLYYHTKKWSGKKECEIDLFTESYILNI